MSLDLVLELHTLPDISPPTRNFQKRLATAAAAHVTVERGPAGISFCPPKAGATPAILTVKGVPFAVLGVRRSIHSVDLF
eukprot:SAG31_NODE_18897_length_619_cov_0.780769_1_plen_80_part_00